MLGPITAAATSLPMLTTDGLMLSTLSALSAEGGIRVQRSDPTAILLPSLSVIPYQSSHHSHVTNSYSWNTIIRIEYDTSYEYHTNSEY